MLNPTSWSHLFWNFRSLTRTMAAVPELRQAYAVVRLAQVTGQVLSASAGLLFKPQLAEAEEGLELEGTDTYLHGTHKGAAAAIRTSRKLLPGSYLTLSGAYDSKYNKTAIQMNPAQYRDFTGMTRPLDVELNKGSWFVNVTAEPGGVTPVKPTSRAPEYRVIDPEKITVGEPYENTNL